MAALTKDRHNINTVDAHPSGFGFILEADVIASDIIYKGAFVKEGTAGVAPCAGTDTAFCFGYALEQADNSAGSAGDVRVKIHVGGVIEHAVTSAAFTDLGAAVYSSDDQTLVLTATNEFVGHIIGWNFVTSNPIIKMDGTTDAASA